ncbi:hypothetical protein BDY17DRAFT_289195 [Neohortaea acidophila]|uniref:BTB domain-containing protein n=1 Tax=Neohortaea acidophila TaxID=245834 RepID=A0A6A6Q597_9PEZI|nr:uncharacterized protein BDY17DRAFT_289195 [Neohortaea acidophila]KAF2487560.1 hypothetical protein BDY17DRAFT_289195 [Neohortaea acidophila]
MDTTYTGDNAGAAGTMHMQLEAAGDVVLVVGEPPVYAIMVSSDRLARLSPVFEAMLSPVFRERLAGQRSLEPEEFYLRDDDVDAMLHICLMLYNHQPQNQPLKGSAIHGLLKTMEKYHCRDAFAMQVNDMVRHQLEQDTPTWESAILNTAIAYLADDVAQFKAHTSRLITAFTIKFLSTREFEGGDTLPLDALIVMFDKRQIARRMILHKLPRACVNDGSTLEGVCGGQVELRIIDQSNNIDEVFRAMEVMPAQSHVGALYPEVKQECSGLCLKCVKQGLIIRKGETCGSCPGD